MLEPISAATIVRIVCNSYLLSTCILLAMTSGGWWLVSHLEQQDRPLPKWFS